MWPESEAVSESGTTSVDPLWDTGLSAHTGQTLCYKLQQSSETTKC